MYSEKPGDVIVFAHGHILSAIVKRWVDLALEFPLDTMFEPGGVGVLSYKNHDVSQPALLIGVGLPIPL
jgi:broad specificity phosphatase PhoE